VKRGRYREGGRRIMRERGAEIGEG